MGISENTKSGNISVLISHALTAAFLVCGVPSAIAFDDDLSFDFKEETEAQPVKQDMLRPKFDFPTPLTEEEEDGFGFPKTKAVKETSVSPQPTSPQTPDLSADKSSKSATPKKKAQKRAPQHQVDIVTKVKNGMDFSVEEIEAWIKKTANINICFDNGKTMLIYMVAKSSNMEALRLLLEYGADVQTPCTPRYEALFVAAANNPTAEVLDALINSGANLVEKDSEGNNALLLASTYNSSPKVLEMLIDYGLKLDEKNKLGFDALMLASFQNKHLSILQTIIDNEVNVNAPDKEGRTALMAAAVRGSNPIMQYLVRRGADFNATDKQGISVLDYFNKRKYLQTLNYDDNPYDTPSERLQKQFAFIAENHLKYNNMLRNGIFSATPDETIAEAINNLADIDTPDSDGCSPLINAIRNHNTASVVSKLLTAKATPDARCFDGRTALMFLSAEAASFPARALSDSPATLAQMLTEGGADINAQDDNGNTALIYALANQADINYITALLVQNANTNLANNDNITPLWLALQNQLPAEVLKKLIEYGADVNHKNPEGETMLWEALRKNDEPTAIALLRGGADTSIPNEDGDFPLWRVFEKGGSAQLVESVILAQKDLNQKNASGDTPLLYALKNEFPAQLIKLLLERGANPEIEDSEGRNAMDILQNNRFFNAAVQRRTREQVLSGED